MFVVNTILREADLFCPNSVGLILQSTKQHINISDYKGWQIGMFSHPIDQKDFLIYGEKSDIGEYVIALYNPNN